MNESTSSLSAGNRVQPSHEEISRRAQELWERYGRPTGRDEEIWLEAERALQTTPEAAPTAPESASLAEASASLTEAPMTSAPTPSAAPRKSRAGSAIPKMPGARGAKNAGR